MAYLETDKPINLGSDGSNSWNDSWIWIILIFALLGFGNGGYGRNSGSGATDGYVLATDFANIERKIDGVNNGICDGFYAMNTGMLNGFSGLTQSVMTSGYETRSAIAGLSSALADCCCKTQTAIQGVNYNLAMQTNTLQQALCTGFRDIIDSQTASYRALHDEIVANRIEDKNAQIAAQQSEINALRLRASQEAQNAYLIGQLKPCPTPAYVVPNPNCCYGTSTCGSVL